MPLPLSRRIELAMLLALCFFLPLYEAPKALAWLAYVLVWLANRARTRDFGAPWDRWDTLIAVWIASGFVIAPMAAVHANEWHAAFDVVRNGAVLWLLKRSRLSDEEVRSVFVALIASVLIGLFMAYVQVWTGKTLNLELNSVGHVNHTAIYLAIMFGVCTAWLFSGYRRIVAAAATILLLVSLFVSTSRTGVVVAFIAALVLAAAWWRRSRLPMALTGAVLGVSAIFGALGAAEIFQKHEWNVQAGHMLSHREQVWTIALNIWREHPWFGVGMDNFGRVIRTMGESYYSLYPHGHSLYLNTLAERGIVGAAVVIVLLIAWVVALYRRRPQPVASDVQWIVWGSAASAWIVTAIAGLVNTTFHHEHGLLAALLLGLWLGFADRR